jgi:hypothetical protein
MADLRIVDEGEAYPGAVDAAKPRFAPAKRGFRSSDGCLGVG